MLNPLDTTTDPTSALMRRLQAVEEQLDQLERQRPRVVFQDFSVPTPEAGKARLLSFLLTDGRAGDMFLTKTSDGVETHYYLYIATENGEWRQSEFISP
jgi:hypothetical protein